MSLSNERCFNGAVAEVRGSLCTAAQKCRSVLHPFRLLPDFPSVASEIELIKFKSSTSKSFQNNWFSGIL